MTAPMVVGLGNPLRRDDAAGILAARRLTQVAPGLSVLEASGEGAGLMDAWAGRECVYLIDAVRAGGEPGRLHRLDAHEREIPSDFFHYSTHAFSLAEAVELARALGELPARLVIYGIEGCDFGTGEGLSPAVADGVGRAVAAILQELGEQHA